jgi:YidC/Oxa1 family membrane protein insertase
MEKRAIIAVVLSIAVFYAYYFLFPPAPKVIPKQSAKQAATQTPITTASERNVTPSIPQSLTQTGPSVAKDVFVDTDLYRAVFSSQGASIKSFVLKKFRESNTADGKNVTLINETNPALYALKTGSQGISLSPSAIYTTSLNNLTVNGKEQRTLDFIYTSANGYTVKKTYNIHGDGYNIGLDTQIINNSSNTETGKLELMFPYHVGDKDKQSRFEVSGAVTFANNEFKSLKLKDLESGPIVFDKNISWTGFADKYFLSVVLSNGNNINEVRTVKGTENYMDSMIMSPQFSIASGQTYSVSYRLFLGPKELDILKAQGNNLEQALNLGWFSAIAKPLLYVLKFFYKYTHNYGVAIIIITVILKILFFPLTHKSYKSMKEMQKLQPKMLELREKYKDDREALNRATMELYKTHKVNPLGGCLPMVVQIPVFFALYKALMFSIELRHAPFIFWITDLSAKDPYYITPIIMGVTMFIQQKMTPSTMDPTQAKVMLALPIVFTFMFLNFPSGLVLYWLVNNILTIAQQAYINRLIKE